MTEKAKVKVELDTAPAKAKLREFAKEGEAAAGRANDSLSGGFGRAAALGGVAGAGFGLAQRAASRLAGFIPDVISEATVGFRAGIDASFKGVEARAARGAREQTKSAYAEIIGRMSEPSVTPQARNYFNNIRDLTEISERGKSVIDQELGGEMVEDAITTIVSAINEGFASVISTITFGIK